MSFDSRHRSSAQAIIGMLLSLRACSLLRVHLYIHLQRLPLAYHDTHALGDTISRCTADVDTIDTLFSSGVAGLATDMVRLVTVSIAMVVLSPPLTLVAALVLPFLAWITPSFRIRIRDAERQSRVAIGMMNTHLQETLGGGEVIRAFGRKKEQTSSLTPATTRTAASIDVRQVQFGYSRRLNMAIASSVLPTCSTIWPANVNSVDGKRFRGTYRNIYESNDRHARF